MQSTENAQECPGGIRRQADDAAAPSGPIQHSLEILPHGAEDACPDIEGVIHPFPWRCCAQVYGIAKVLDIEQLIPVRAIAQHRKCAPFKRPAIEQLERTQPLRTDEALWPQDAYAKTVRTRGLAQVLGLYLRFS